MGTQDLSFFEIGISHSALLNTEWSIVFYLREKNLNKKKTKKKRDNRCDSSVKLSWKSCTNVVQATMCSVAQKKQKMIFKNRIYLRHTAKGTFSLKRHFTICIYEI